MPEPESPAPSAPPSDTPLEGEDEPVRDPGGRLQDIEDPVLRSAVARQRGSKGAQSTHARARASSTERGARPVPGSRTADPSAPFDPLERLRYESEHAALPSDRIRAATELARAERARAEGDSDEVAQVLAWRAALLTLPSHERLDWLLGEVRNASEGHEEESDDDEGGWLVPPVAEAGGGIPAPR